MALAVDFRNHSAIQPTSGVMSIGEMIEASLDWPYTCGSCNGAGSNYRARFATREAASKSVVLRKGIFPIPTRQIRNGKDYYYE
jgi:hypothetical protein